MLNRKKSYFNSSCRANNIQAGRSMIEMLGVLAIMAVITVLSIMAYTMAMRNVKVNQTKSDVAIISQQIHSIYPFNDYSAIPSVQNTMFYQKFIATGLMKGGNAFGHGGSVLAGNNDNGYQILSAYPGSTDKSKFMIGISKVTSAECKLLAAQDWSGAAKDATGAYLFITNKFEGANVTKYSTCNYPDTQAQLDKVYFVITFD